MSMIAEENLYELLKKLFPLCAHLEFTARDVHGFIGKAVPRCRDILMWAVEQRYMDELDERTYGLCRSNRLSATYRWRCSPFNVEPTWTQPPVKPVSTMGATRFALKALIEDPVAAAIDSMVRGGINARADAPATVLQSTSNWLDYAPFSETA